MPTRAIPYHPSGRVSWRLAVWLPVLLACAVLVGAPSGVVLPMVPLAPGAVIAWVLAVAIGSVALGMLVRGTIVLAHVRNRAAARTVAYVAALVAASASCVVAAVVSYVKQGAPLGAGGFHPRLLLEPLVVVGPSAIVPGMLLLAAAPFGAVAAWMAVEPVGAPYCEACRRWAGPFQRVRHMVHISIERMAALLVRWDMPALVELAHRPLYGHAYHTLVVARCPGCLGFAVLRAELTRVRRDKRHTVEVVGPLRVPGEDVDQLQRVPRAPMAWG